MSVIGTIYKSLTGLMGFTKALDNASNNIANMNTPGYKGRDVFFQELTAFPEGQGERHRMAGSLEGGGVKIAGSGVRFAAGDINATGNNTDLAISGNGFFVLRGEGEQFYTRAGQFRLNDQGILIDPDTNYRVAAMAEDGSLVDLNLDSTRLNEAKPTTKASLRGNLDTGTAPGGQVPNSSAAPVELRVVGENGEVHVLRAVFTRQLGSQWALQLNDTAGNAVVPPHLVSFGSDGAIRADATEFETTFQPFKLLTPSEMKEEFSSPPSYTFTAGDPASAPKQAFSLNSEPYLMLRKEGQISYVRAVELAFDTEGNLVDQQTGQRALAVGTSGSITDFSLGALKENPPQATTKVTLQGNLDPAAAVGVTIPSVDGSPIVTTVVRPDGSRFEIHFTLSKTATNTWSLTPRDKDGNLIGTARTLAFNTSGELDSTSLNFSMAIPKADSGTFDVTLSLSDSAARKLTQKSDVDAVLVAETKDGLEKGLLETLTFDAEGYSKLKYSNGKEVTGPRLAAANRGSELSIPLKIDLGGLTALSGVTTLAVGSIDGREVGRLTTFAFGADGQVTLNYSNGEEEKGPQLALAQFSNLQGLTSVGAALFRATPSAGISLGHPGKNGFGELRGNSIELSNVELSREFADIIVIQRGYQASSQIMNVSNELIEQLYNNVRGGS